MPLDTKKPVTMSIMLTRYKTADVTSFPKDLRNNFVLKKSQKKLYFLYVINPRKKPTNTSVMPPLTLSILTLQPHFNFIIYLFR